MREKRMPLNIKKATDLKEEIQIRGLLVGRKGCGKSTAASTFPKPMLIIDIDKRIQSLRGVKGVEYIQFKKLNFEELQETFYQLSLQVDRGTYKYKTLLFSSTTSLQTFLLEEALILIPQEGKQQIGKLKIPGMRHYLYCSEAINQLLLNQLFYFPGNVLLEAHVVTKFNKTGDPVGQMLLNTEKISERIPTFFNEVWEFSKELGASPSVPPRHYVNFKSDIADTAFTQLPFKQIDITGKKFYPELQRMLGREVGK